MKTRGLRGRGAVLSLISLVAACGGVIDLKTPDGAGGSVAGGDDSGGGPSAIGGSKSPQGGTTSIGGKTAPGGTTSIGGKTATGGATSRGGTGGAIASSGGTGGVMSVGCSDAPGPVAGDGINLLIDAFDVNDTNVVTAGVGDGVLDWFVPGPDTGAAAMTLSTIVPGGYSGSAWHITGSELGSWAAAVVSLNGVGSSFDASKYSGIAFYMKGTTRVAEGFNRLIVQVGMPDELDGPRSCCSAATLDSMCYSRHQIEIDVPQEWQEVRIGWGDFEQAPWGWASSHFLSPNRISDIVFALDQDSDPISFDIWIDDLRFMAFDDNGPTVRSAGGAGGVGP